MTRDEYKTLIRATMARRRLKHPEHSVGEYGECEVCGKNPCEFMLSNEDVGNVCVCKEHIGYYLEADIRYWKYGEDLLDRDQDDSEEEPFEFEDFDPEGFLWEVRMILDYSDEVG
jgi:hypothetical protein